MKVKFTLGIGLVGCRREEVIEFDDDMTEEEIENEWQEWIWGYIDGGFKVVEDGK